MRVNQNSIQSVCTITLKRVLSHKKKCRVIQMQKRMALVYPTERMRRLKLVPLNYGNKECYILFRGIPVSFVVRQLERVNSHGKEADDRVGCLTSQWLLEES